MKKGEHAALIAYLWKYTDKPSRKQREAAEAAEEDPEASGGDHFYKAKSHLFSYLQVEKSK